MISKIRSLAFSLIAVAISNFVIGGEFNGVLSVGDAIPTWTDLKGTDGKTHSSADLSHAKVVVVVFTCNSCPYALDVEDRLIQLVLKYRDQGVIVVAINVNQADEDSLAAMTERAKVKQFEFPYLFDPTQKIARDFGATRTPEFFVFNGHGKLAYQGSLDDSPEGQSVSKHYVADAIDAVLGSKAVEVQETVPIGCNIRYERSRRTRKVE